MKQYPTSAKIVSLVSLGGPVAAIYPNAITAARIVGVSRQAIAKSLADRTPVRGHIYLRYGDWIALGRSDEQQGGQP